jgi:Rieske Fe-S protein
MEYTPDTQGRRMFMLRFASVSAGILAAGTLPGLTGCEENTIKPQPRTASFRIEGNSLIIDAASIPELGTPGGYAQFDAKDFQLVVVRISTSTVSALSRICTHAGCTVNANASGSISGDRFVCSCHGSAFALTDGGVLRGPATEPLQRFPATLSGNTITVDLS